MVRLFTSLFLVLAAALAAAADDKPSPAQRLTEIKKNFNTNNEERSKAAKGLNLGQDRAQIDQVNRDYFEKQQPLMIAALDLAKSNPRSETGFDALTWLLTNSELGVVLKNPSDHKLAVNLLAEQYAANPKIAQALAKFAYWDGKVNTSWPSLRAELPPLFSAVVEKNPDRIARAQAALGLAWLARNRLSGPEAAGDADLERLGAEAERAFENAIRDYGDCPFLKPGSGTVGEAATAGLFAVKHLRRGAAAPEIDAKDLDGARMKLSDNRGKVVLLVFWGSWCKPCMADVPHERELAEKFKKRPFVIVGVDLDSKEAGQAAVKNANITWRSFWDESEAINKQWLIFGWPTTYVIDHKGIIRHKDLRGVDLDQPLEALIAVAEKQEAGGAN